MDTRLFERIGFTEGEVRVYFSLLELGETTTGPIIEKSGITGSKVYEILDRLIKKGLAGYVTKEKTKYFQAASPKRLLDYLGRKESELKKTKGEIEKIIPELERKQKLEEESQSSYVYAGFEGVKTVFNLILETLNPHEEYCAFTLGEELNEKNVMLFLKKYHAKRIKKKIKAKIIANKADKSLFEKELSHLKYLQIKYSEKMVPLGIFIFGDYVVTFTFKREPLAFLIKSRQIANSYKDFFNDLWESIK